MKRDYKRPCRPGWIVAWIVQFIEMLIMGALSSLALGLHPIAYGAALWVLMPLAGAFTACRAVQRGLLNYAAWIAPPVCLFAAHTAIWGYVPPAGAMLVCAFISLIGAAAGEVIIRQKKNNQTEEEAPWKKT